MIKPIGKRVVVEQLNDHRSTTESGIYVGDISKKEKFLESGKVVDLGSRVDVGAMIGDTVYYDRWAGTVISSDGKSLLVIEQKDIQAIQ